MGHRLTTAAIEPRTLRVRDVVTTYRVGKTKLYELMNSGALRSIKVGGTRLIPVDACEALFMGQGSEPAEHPTSLSAER